jgi:hypothetical protein
MSNRRLAVSLALALAIAAVPTWAATPAPQADPASTAALLDAIFAPATGVPVPASTLPFHGYCSQTCHPCWSNDTPPCPPDPDTGFSQLCTRIQIC